MNMTIKIRHQMCRMYGIPVCRFCKFPYADKVRPLYTKEGQQDLKREIKKHMKECHQEYTVI